MKTVPRKAFALLLLLLILCLTIPAAYADASVQTREYDRDVITGFESLGDAAAVRTDHKLALITLEQQFPAELTVRLGGTAYYEEAEDGSPRIVRISGYQSGRVEVAWKCLEDYDADLDAFHFTPVPEGYTLAEGLTPPVITVVVENTFTAPPPGRIPQETDRDVPILGAVSDNGTPLPRGALPSYFNSYEQGKLPPVRDQGQYGTCWVYSVLGAMEADLIHRGAAGTDIDLSELQLAYFTYHSSFDEKNCGEGDSAVSYGLDYLDVGGLDTYAYRTLANMVGCASEADVPYEWAADYFPSPYAGRAYPAPQLTGLYEINYLDTDAIKAAIMEHGGISAGMCMLYDDYYSATYNSYFSDGVEENHSVMFVGWDDNFPRDHFRSDREQPSADGAWLVRNSWGVDAYDFSGYFWMSYEDPGFSENPYVYSVQPWQYQHCYAYDKVCFPAAFYSCGPEATASQIFTVDGGERIEAVGFETMQDRLAITVSLSCGEESVSFSTTTGYPGFYLIPLDTPLTVAERSEVTMELSISGNDNIRVPVQLIGDYNHCDAVYFHAECASGGIVINGKNGGLDSRLKLFTNDYGEPAGGVAVNAENFPNPSFRAWVEANADLDHDRALSAAEIAAVTEIDVSGGPDTPEEKAREADAQEGAYGIRTSDQALTTTLKGVEHFTNLETLRCAYSQLTALDLSGNRKLRNLDCRHNRLTSLDIRMCPALFSIPYQVTPRLEDGALLYLDAKTGSSLQFDWKLELTPALHFGTGVPISRRFPDENFRAWVAENCDIDRDSTLVDFEISAVTEINVSGSTAGPIASLQGIEIFTALKALHCYNKPSLTSLDVRGCSALEYLNCCDCGIELLTIGVNPALRTLCCNTNQLTALDVHGCTALENLYCRDNKLESLNLHGCTALWDLSCRNNSLTVLDLRDCAALSSLFCNGNQLKKLDLRACPKLLSLTAETPPVKTEAFIYHSSETAYLQYDRKLTLIPRLPDLILPNTLKKIGEEAFSGGAFVYAALSENTVKLGANAFGDCAKLKYVYIPNAEARIDRNAFANVQDLTIIGKAGSTAEAFASAHGYAFLPAG